MQRCCGFYVKKCGTFTKHRWKYTLSWAKRFSVHELCWKKIKTTWTKHKVFTKHNWKINT